MPEYYVALRDAPSSESKWDPGQTSGKRIVSVVEHIFRSHRLPAALAFGVPSTALSCTIPRYVIEKTTRSMIELPGNGDGFASKVNKETYLFNEQSIQKHTMAILIFSHLWLITTVGLYLHAPSQRSHRAGVWMVVITTTLLLTCAVRTSNPWTQAALVATHIPKVISLSLLCSCVIGWLQKRNNGGSNGGSHEGAGASLEAPDMKEKGFFRDV